MLVAERGAADNTKQAYERDLTDVAAWLAGRKMTLDNANTDDLRGYLDDLSRHEGGTALRTIARRLSALRQFYRFVVSAGLRADDPARTHRRPKQGRPLPKVLSRERGRPPDRGGRSAGAARMAAAGGAGGADLRLGPAHFRADGPAAGGPRPRSGYLIVKGKGGKERLAPLTNAARTR